MHNILDENSIFNLESKIIGYLCEGEKKGQKRKMLIFIRLQIDHHYCIEIEGFHLRTTIPEMELV